MVVKCTVRFVSRIRMYVSLQQWPGGRSADNLLRTVQLTLVIKAMSLPRARTRAGFRGDEACFYPYIFLFLMALYHVAHQP